MSKSILQLSAEEALTTTRSVRKRLDLERAVAFSDIRDAIEVALQAPSGGNVQSWTWIAIDDKEIKMQVADLYRKFYAIYREHMTQHTSDDSRSVSRMQESGDHLAAHLHRVPWLVIPCITGPVGRADTEMAAFGQATTWASIYPAVWSFQLALRNRGLASCLTTNHLAYEREVAELLGIPFETTNQAALIPVAHALGTKFRRAERKPPGEVLRRNGW